MALNKSMHPRNKYKDKPPDFAHLATKYPEFRQYVQVNLSGRFSLNFKDPEAVRALTCTLLKEDFGLIIDIPLERLIPTVPLRLNYIHWVEDLIGHHESDKKTLRRGIDIGTGASCIYPLLGATLNGWYFLATEVDDICFNYAKKNVEQNNLSDLIKVVKVPQKTLLMDALKEESEIIYDFCMCNPPFFANQLEAKGVNSRNPRRPPPSSINTGGVTEIMAEGGELEFVKRIIHDSLQLKNQLRWYSCMLGKKCSLAPLKEELRIQGIPKVAHTEFYQGRTMRWALAWSFYDDVIVPSPPSKKRKLEKSRKPIMFTVLECTVNVLSHKAVALGCEALQGVTVVTNWIERILNELKVQHKRVPCGKDEESLFLTAIENSWIHIRRKKRERGRHLRELPRAPEDFLQTAEKEKPPPKESSTDKAEAAVSEANSKDDPPSSKAQSSMTEEPPAKDESGAMEEPPAMEKGSLTEDPPAKKESGPEAAKDDVMETQHAESTLPSCESGGHVRDEKPDASKNVSKTPTGGGQSEKAKDSRFLFKCLINAKKEDNNVAVEMHWLEGQDRDLMNQLCTYLRNQLFRLVAS
ncbi:RNA N6-adenosine-methyltransferase METTL16 [Rhinatrema bivittatum]|uniref:RNA N6-adenosine-methyltransferase METTL16 n=1 Tax=Rhinatrema bivittatum TaxID=194408 RepID=UPI00112618DF|nr:RNA N6-adenosine-methyltransferase METTL16 [Rhinatrema bivittatum]XP_029468383.1 RNA N6-adenosine-methyltransferase METTL16 [Rhinatrema bivittatum]